MTTLTPEVLEELRLQWSRISLDAEGEIGVVRPKGHFGPSMEPHLIRCGRYSEALVEATLRWAAFNGAASH